MAKKESAVNPSSIALSRLFVLSDGKMTYSKNGNKENQKPVLVERVQVLTVNTPDSKNTEKGTVSAPQLGDVAKIGESATELNVKFNMRVLPMVENSLGMMIGESDIIKKTLNKTKEFQREMLSTDQGKEVILAHAKNIMSGLWLWRNLSLSDEITITVTKGNDVLTSVVGSEEENSNAETLAEWIHTALSNYAINFCIGAELKMAGGTEVFPSQTFANGSNDGVSKVLYSKYLGKIDDRPMVTGQAMIRNAKIGNAIRRVDVWYPNFEDIQITLPVEVFGACREHQAFYRNGKGSATECMTKMVNENSDDGLFGASDFKVTSDAKYLFALMIRGAVITNSKSD